MDSVIQLVIFIVLLTLGFIVGSILEKKHYASLKEREAKVLNFAAIPTGAETILIEADDWNHVERAEFVTGAVVIAEDYFKSFLAKLKTIVGGNLTSYESLLDRARREAILRMKESALHADVIVNCRLETMGMGDEETGSDKMVAAVDILASGTALTFTPGHRLKKRS